MRASWLCALLPALACLPALCCVSAADPVSLPSFTVRLPSVVDRRVLDMREYGVVVLGGEHPLAPSPVSARFLICFPLPASQRAAWASLR